MKVQIKGKQNSRLLGTRLRKNGKKWKEVITNGYEETLGVKHILIILIVVMFSWVYEYVKMYYFIHFKYV